MGFDFTNILSLGQYKDKDGKNLIYAICDNGKILIWDSEGNEGQGIVMKSIDINDDEIREKLGAE